MKTIGIWFYLLAGLISLTNLCRESHSGVEKSLCCVRVSRLVFYLRKVKYARVGPCVRRLWKGTRDTWHDYCSSRVFNLCATMEDGGFLMTQDPDFESHADAGRTTTAVCDDTDFVRLIYYFKTWYNLWSARVFLRDVWLCSECRFCVDYPSIQLCKFVMFMRYMITLSYEPSIQLTVLLMMTTHARDDERILCV